MRLNSQRRKQWRTSEGGIQSYAPFVNLSVRVRENMSNCEWGVKKICYSRKKKEVKLLHPEDILTLTFPPSLEDILDSSYPLVKKINIAEVENSESFEEDVEKRKK